MAALRDLIALHPSAWLAIGGLLIGVMFGFIVSRTNFCTMGSISDIVSFGDYRRFRAWVLAGAVAIIGAQALAAAGVVPLAKSMYLGTTFNWFGHSVGGLMFGYGMVFAGGCASRNLTRVGSGDLRALMALLVVGVFAYMTIGGILGPLRDIIERTTAINLPTRGIATQGIGDILARFVPGSPAGLNALAGVLIVAGMLLYCFRSADFRGSGSHIFSGLAVGLCVITGWALTGLAFDDLAERPTAPISLTFIRPTADALEWLQRFTAGMVPGFGVATVFGAILGAFLSAVSTGRFRLATFSDVADTKRVLFGAALMGIGGVMALGCTLGQAITGISTLALGSFVTFAAIVAGGVFGMRRLEAALAAET